MESGFKMTDQQINERIAVICGWRRSPEFDFITGEKKYATFTKDGIVSNETTLPDYANDLNACHEFEMIESILKGEAYNNMLDFLTLQQGVLIWNASARTRCEALLRVNGKWVDV